MNQLLQNAIDALTIEDVYLRESSAKLAEEYDPKYDSESDGYSARFMHLVERTEVLKVVDENQVETSVLRVGLMLGIRFFRSNDNEEAPSTKSRSKKVELSSEDIEEVKWLAQIEARYFAEYSMKKVLKQEEIDQFALGNASYHVWPYWREFLMSMSTRMNLPKIMLPTMQLAMNRHKVDE